MRFTGYGMLAAVVFACAPAFAQNTLPQQVVTPDPNIAIFRKQPTRIGATLNEGGTLIRARARTFPTLDGMGNSKLNLQAISVEGKARGFSLGVYDKRDTEAGFLYTYQKFIGSPESATVYLDSEEGVKLAAALRDMVKAAENKDKSEEEILSFNGTDAYQIVLTGVKGDQTFRLFCGPQQIRYTFRKWKDVEQFASMLEAGSAWLGK